MNLVLAPRWASSSLQLSGTGYVDCGTPFILSDVSSFTLEAWVKPSNSGALNFMSVVGNVDNASGGQYQLFLNGGHVYAYVGIAPYLIQSPQPITSNEWHHIASTFDGTTKTLTLYVDGNQVAQAVFSGTLPSSGTNALIGAAMQQNAPTWYYQGEIGRVMIWNSVRDPEAILNDSVQVNIYRATENPDLIFYVDFSVMPTVDDSGNNIPLTYKNSAQYSFNVPSVVLGSTGYVNCGNSPDYSIPGNRPYTIEGWFFPDTNSGGTLISYGQGSNWEYRVSYQNNQVIGQRNSDTLQIVSSSAVIPLSYYHFALTYNESTKALALYINGNLQCVDYFENPVVAVPNGTMLVGAQFNAGNAPTNFFNGAIQCVRVWNVCLEQSEVYQWMYNDIVDDSRLIANFDFTVNPPIDSTDRASLDLLGGATQELQQINIPVNDPVALLGLPQSINAIYLNQNPEAPIPPPPSQQFADQPELFSADHKEASWNDFVEMFGISNDAGRMDFFRAQFEKSFAKAEQMMNSNSNLSKVFTRTDENGMTRIVHHGIKGDTLVYEGAIDAESDCVLWWIQFIFMLTVGFLQALGLLPSTGNIATRIYNLVRANATVMAAITSTLGKTITATAAIGLIGVIYRQGLMWTIIKFVLTSCGWFALFWVLKKVIAIATGLEAAAILAGFIVWAAQLTILALKYNSTCGKQVLLAPPNTLTPAMA